MDPLFLVIRHRKENLKKCSLRHCQDRTDIEIFSYPVQKDIPQLERYTLLDVDGEELTADDRAPFLILDATWRYAAVMRRQIQGLASCRKRRIPSAWRTAYPRRQMDCPDPERGLASIEAMFAVCCVCHYPTDTLLEGYFWKDQFLQLNHRLLEGAFVNLS